MLLGLKNMFFKLTENLKTTLPLCLYTSYFTVFKLVPETKAISDFLYLSIILMCICDNTQNWEEYIANTKVCVMTAV